MNYKKINGLLDNGINLILILFFISFFMWVSDSSFQLSSKSFDEINELNNEMKSLYVFESKQFNDKATILYEVNKLIDPSFFDKYYFLDDYIINYNYSGYKLNDLNRILIDDEDIRQLKTIKNISYSTKSEFEQEIKNLLGVNGYKKHWDFIYAVNDNTSYWNKLGFYLLIIIFIVIIVLKIIVDSIVSKKENEKEEIELNENITHAKKEIAEKPKEITPAWELANFTLQKYYNKNLSQVDSIYKLSIAVMIMGFALIVTILIAAAYNKLNVKLESIGIIAGIITEFIGATFLFIYKSTISQALEHSKSLEDINNVGMSIKIIESISLDEKNKERLDEAKIEIAKKLIQSK